MALNQEFCVCGKSLEGKRKTCGNTNCKRIYHRQYVDRKRKLNPGLYNQKIRINQYKIKRQVMAHYGGNPPKCACCGETEYRFLSLDHINGHGKQHRDSLKKNGGGIFLYRWLLNQNFPEGFQILCMNCNFAKNRHKKQFCPVHHPELYSDLTLFSEWYSILGYKEIIM